MQPIDSNHWAIQGLFQNSYPLPIYIVLLIVTFYIGIFTTLNNYYVFRPKLINSTRRFQPEPNLKFTHMLFKMSVSLASNIAVISLAFASAFFSSSTHSLQVFVISDGVWMGVLGSIVAYRNKDQKPQTIQKKLTIKNALVLLVIYIWMIVHFQMGFYLLYFPLVMFVFYILNELMTQYFDKVQEALHFLLSDTAEEDLTAKKSKLKPHSQFPDITTLSTLHAPNQQEMSHLQEQFLKRRGLIKLKSKAKVYEKLHDIYLRVHISHEKYIVSEMKRVITYFGRLNGTIPLDRHGANTLVQKNTIHSQQHLESYPKVTTTVESDTGNIIDDKTQQEPPEWLLYVFPIKLLEYSSTISVVFSILINLGFGILLDYTLQVLTKMGFGTVFCCALSFLLVPLVQSSSKLVQFFSETISLSIFRYGIVGLFLSISCFSSLVQGQLFYVTWIVTPNLPWIVTAQAGFLIYAVIVVLFLKWQEYRLLTLAFVVCFGSIGYLTYMDSIYIF